MEELAGILASGGLLIAAGLVKKAVSDSSSELGAARVFYDQVVAEALRNDHKHKTLVLANVFESPYQTLQHALSHLSVHSEITEAGLKIDLNFLLKDEQSFSGERKLFQALVKEGLILCPGETRNIRTPGYFFISAPVLTEREAEIIAQRLARVIKPVLAGAKLDSLNSSTSTEDLESPKVQPTPRKRKVEKAGESQEDDVSDTESVASRAGQRRKTVSNKEITEPPTTGKKARKPAASNEST